MGALKNEHVVLQKLLRQSVEDNEILFKEMNTFRRLSFHFATKLKKAKRELADNDLNLKQINQHLQE